MAAGVDTGQGFHFARPLEAEAIDAMLGDPHARDSRWALST